MPPNSRLDLQGLGRKSQLGAEEGNATRNEAWTLATAWMREKTTGSRVSCFLVRGGKCSQLIQEREDNYLK